MAFVERYMLKTVSKTATSTQPRLRVYGPDGIIICEKEKTEDIKELVEKTEKR